MTSIAQALDQGIRLHQTGDLAAAEQIYHQILTSAPDHPEALHLLGALYSRQGKHDLALQYMGRAVALAPGTPLYLANYGECLRVAGRKPEALTVLREAVRVRPDSAIALANLAITLQELGQVQESLSCYQKSLALDPNRGVIHNNFGNMLKELGRLKDAETCYRNAVRLMPGAPAAYNNLGTILQEQGRFDEAAAALREALRLAPNLAEAYSNLGVIYKLQGKMDEAAQCYRDALQRQPNLPMARNNLGTVLQEQGKFDEAAAEYREAVRLQPNFHQCASNLLFCLNHSHRATRQQAIDEHVAWGRAVEALVPTIQPHTNLRDPERKLRVGYVSGDFRAHAIYRFFEPLLRLHDRNRFDVYLYSETRSPDVVTDYFRSMAQAWRVTTGMPDADVAQQIRHDQIDILVDLAGHTAYNRLPVFAHLPAPVQATFIGYPDTTGLSRMHYRITDAVMDPLDDPVAGTEKLLRLACGNSAFSTIDDAPPVGDLPALSRGYITFGSLHRLAKINPEVLEVWADVMRRVPGSRLLMLRDNLIGQRREDIRQCLISLGVSDDRLDLRSESGGESHLDAFSEIDISLDTFPYTGGTISCESCWMGVPLASIQGDRPVARGGASLLTRIGLPEWVAKTPAEYVGLVVDLASDLGRLAEIRRGLRDRMRNTLCDAQGFTTSLEAAYRDIWSQWCAGR